MIFMFSCHLIKAKAFLTAIKLSSSTSMHNCCLQPLKVNMVLVRSNRENSPHRNEARYHSECDTDWQVHSHSYILAYCILYRILLWKEGVAEDGYICQTEQITHSNRSEKVLACQKAWQIGLWTWKKVAWVQGLYFSVELRKPCGIVRFQQISSTT